jgi:hypothetical protein
MIASEHNSVCLCVYTHILHTWTCTHIYMYMYYMYMYYMYVLLVLYTCMVHLHVFSKFVPAEAELILHKAKEVHVKTEPEADF